MKIRGCWQLWTITSSRKMGQGTEGLKCLSKVNMPWFVRFKVSLPFQPYLYLLIAKENIQEVTAFLSKKYGQYITGMSQVCGPLCRGLCA